MPLLQSVETLENRVLLAATYNLIDLGVTNLPAQSAVLDVDDAGEVLGPGGVFVYKNDKVYPTALSVNGAAAVRLDPAGGAIVGTNGFGTGASAVVFRHKVGDPIPRHHPFTVRGVGTLPAGWMSVANAIVTHGHNVVGHSADPTPNVGSHGFLGIFGPFAYSLVDLNDIRAAGQNWIVQDAKDINQTGQILVSGITSGTDQTRRLGLMLPKRGGTTFVELTGTADAMIDPQARDLNDKGQVAGSALNQAGLVHALLWSGTKGAADLGTLGGLEARALGVNNVGYVVGDATTAKNRTHGFIYDPTTGRMRDLNSLVAGTGITIDHAVAISNSNMVAAEGIGADGERHGLLLIPKNPTPAPAAGIRFKNSGGVTINGTAGADEILIEDDPKHAGEIIFSFNGKKSRIEASKIGLVSIHGGAGNDHIEIRNTTARFACDISGDGGNDRIIADHANASSFLASGGEDDDLIRGPMEIGDRISGDAGNDTLVGGDQADSLAGGFGDDLLIGGAGNNTLRGEAGNDTLMGGAGNEKIDGSAGNDSVVAGDGADSILTEAGDDTVSAGGGVDTVFAGDGNDRVFGGDGDDLIYGDAGDDTILGEGGNDTLGGDIGFGGDQAQGPTPRPGNDSLNGGPGNDYLVGSRATLTLNDDNGRDTFTGGAGGDVINMRGDDIVTDAETGDIIPTARTYGQGAFAVQQTATFQVSIPIDETHVTNKVTSLALGAGNFAGSTFYLDAGGTLHMQDTVNRKFYLGEFLRNWGVPLSAPRHGGVFGRFTTAGVTLLVNGQAVHSPDKTVIHNGDAVELRVAI